MTQVSVFDMYTHCEGGGGGELARIQPMVGSMGRCRFARVQGRAQVHTLASKEAPR